jgi:hypothetical protein
VEGFKPARSGLASRRAAQRPQGDLAQDIPADYVRRRREHGARSDDPALAVWDALPEELRPFNRAQAADLGEKLRTVGCELAPH